MDFYDFTVSGLNQGVTEPITVADVKEWALIENSVEDAVISSLITSCREVIENYISRHIVAKNVKVYIEDPSLVDNFVELPFAADPEEVTVDVDGLVYTNYEIIGVSNDFILFNSPVSKVTITYVSQPVVSASEMELVKSEIKRLIESKYNERGNLEGVDKIVSLDDQTRKSLNTIKAIWL